MIRTFLSKVKPVYWFLLLLVLVALLYDYHEIMSMRPCGIHQWRSAVSAAFPVNLADGGSFFRTQTHALLADNLTSDVTVVEFPLIYWIISLFYRVFGVNELWFRLVQVAVGFMGLTYLFKASYILTKDWFYAGVIPMIVFTSPIYIYYLNGFIPDSVALSLTFGGLFYSLKFSENKRTRTWVVSMLFFLLAGLTKTSSLLPYLGIGGVAVLDLVQRLRGKEETGMFVFGWKHILAYGSVLLLIFAWYFYAKIYSDAHTGSVSAVELRPIWVLDHNRQLEVWEGMKKWFWEGAYHYPWFLFLTLAIFLLMLPFYKKSNPFIYSLNILVVTGALAFTLMFFRSMKVHDYYQINNLFILVSIWLGFFTLAAKQWPRIYGSIWTKLVVVLLMVRLWYPCDQNLLWRYTHENYTFYHSKENIARFGIEPYLEELGIDRDTKVHCTPDPSINISLYMCNRKGLTDFGPLHDMPLEDRVEVLKKVGIEYVIIGNRESFPDANLDEIFGEKVGQKGTTEIFKVSKDEQ